MPTVAASGETTKLFWVGLYANRTTTTGAHWTYTYGDVISNGANSSTAAGGGCMAVVMDGLWPVAWSVRNCDEQLPYVCQKRKLTLIGTRN